MMIAHRLSVIIPTRNRPSSLRRLLDDIAKQSIPMSDFEVLVVDDQSDEPVEAAIADVATPFRLRMLRNDASLGAHESRRIGLLAAGGSRVLFLDDDIVLTPSVLSDHASAAEPFAIGPIRYQTIRRPTPYYRRQTRLYAEYLESVVKQGSQIPASEIYICNTSGMRKRFIDVFEGVRSSLGRTPLPGDGLDEELIDHQLRHSSEMAQFLPAAATLHCDRKTLREACIERRRRGAAECRLWLNMPELRPRLRSYQTLARGSMTAKTITVKLYWMAPLVFEAVARSLVFLADLPRSGWVPPFVCYPPLAIAFWEGVRSAAPSLANLQSALFESS
jgi:glycosyltransferase involved in cell wall biosynthesis